MKEQFVILLLLSLLFHAPLQAQQTFGGQPLGLRADVSLPKPPLVSLRPLDIEKCLAEDEAQGGNRVAAAQSVDINPAEDGTWTVLENGTEVWRLKLEIPNAYGLMLFYDDFKLAPGAKLFVYRPDLQQILGSYTAESSTGRSRFMTGLLSGKSAVIEYQAPAGSSRQPFRLFRVDGVYRANTKSVLNFGFGTSDACHDNVACPEATDWQAERDAVARIMFVVEEGSGFCTGTLVNNTAQDRRLLFLTAFHCMDGYTPLYDLWRFDFKYASPTCEDPDFEPFYQSILGCDSLAGRRANDFLLLDLYPENTDHLNLHFVGWDRSGIAPDTSAVLSHPSGDLKKFSYSDNESWVFDRSIRWGNGTITPPNHHFLITYSNGTIEPGSSGAGLLDNNHRLIGVLQGDNGTVTCDGAQGFFARISLAWSGGGQPHLRLRDWLDPLGTDTMYINALAGRPIAMFHTPDGIPVSRVGATFKIDGETISYVETGEDGRLEVPPGLPESGILTIELSKDEDEYTNGVRTSDLVEMTQHILGTDTLEAPYQILASDVNLSNSVSTLDMIRIRKLILAIDNDFGEGGAPSWQFISDEVDFSDPLNPWVMGTRSNTITVDLSSDWTLPNFIAVKSGDANGSASPD